MTTSSRSSVAALLLFLSSFAFLSAAKAQQADLSVTKTGPDQAAAGSDVTYTIHVNNLGPENSVPATLVDHIPPGTSFVSVTAAPGWTCSIPNQQNNVVCTTSSVPVGADAVFSLTLNIDSRTAPGTYITNTVDVSTPPDPDPAIGATDPNEENNTAFATTVVPGSGGADLTITKLADSDQTKVDTDVTYTIQVSNNGPGTADNAQWNDTLPGNMTFVSLSQTSGTSVWTCTTPSSGSGGTINCSFPNLPPGNSSFILKGHIPSGTPSGTDYDNIATVSSSTPDPSSENNSALASTTAVAAAPTLTTNVSSSAITIGSSVTDRATLAGGLNATGTITFYVYGPDDALCGGNVGFSSVQNVNGDGVYTSDPFTPTATGTYRFVAVYTGDFQNKAVATACGDANESVVVSKRTSSMVTQASAGTTLGNTISDSATLTAGGTPTGTITFTLFGPNNAGCSGSPIFTSTVPVNGSTTYNSASFKPVTPGTYNWIASYSGDGNTDSFTGVCGAANESVTVTKGTTTTAVTSSVNPSVFGQTVSFTATVSTSPAGAGTVTGTVQFSVDGNALGAPVAVSGGTAQISTSALTVGSHTITATYSGDSNFNGSGGTLAGGQTVNKANTTTAVTSSVNPSAFGQNVTFTATISPVAPGTGTVTGTVQFFVDGNALGSPVAVSNGIAQFNTSTLTAGNHTVTATYSGDANFNGSTGTLSGGQTVVKANPTLTGSVSPTSGSVGTPFTDSAVLSGTTNATGTITFTVYGPNVTNCATAIFTSVRTVTGNATYTSAPFTPSTPGTYYFVASYSGDVNNIPVATTCGAASQTFTVTAASPSPTPSPSPSPTPAQSLNISTRGDTQLGDRVLIGGFIINGNANKSVVLRGLGPSLSSSGIVNPLLNPQLELRGATGNLIFQNKNWKDDQRLLIEGTPFQPSDDRESVIVITLPPGAYSLLLMGENNTTGVGLVEVYDTSPNVDAKLGNLSARGFVQTQEKVMIGGFTLGGNNNPTRIAVRGLGPSLSKYNLSPVLADPTLDLRNQNGTIQQSNDNWQSDMASANALTAAGLALSDPNEAGIFTILPAGQYTAILAGKAGGIGIGLVEVYNLQ